MASLREKVNVEMVNISIVLEELKKLRQARKSAGLTQEELAQRLKTKKTAISRIENHAEDIKLSTLERAAVALGKHLKVRID